jgi:tRNA U34 5-methylaminomethyl-2-thiouridine-forming methyltransferase MnmC
LLPVNLRNKEGEKLLVDFDAVYYTKENPIFEIPVKYFEEGREYEVTISQREKGGKGGAQKERTFIICFEQEKNR